MINSKPKVLVDLSVSYLSNSGIPLDTKWLYKQLANSPDIETYGLLYTLDWSNYAFHIHKNADLNQKYLSYSQYFTYFDLTPKTKEKKLFINKFLFYLGYIKKTYFKENFRLWNIETKDFNEVIYRIFFEGGLGYKDRELILKGNFVITDFFKHAVFARTVSGRGYKIPKLDTSEFDFIIHQDSVPCEVSKNTQKIIRYHDPIPLMSPDLTQESFLSATYHFNSVKKCIEQGAIYVCNSKPVEDELLSIFPKLKGRTTTIPYTVLDIYEPVHDYGRLFDVLSTKLSNVYEQYHDQSMKMVQEARNNPDQFKYITEVATIEPRKNFIKLIKAFNIAKYNLSKKNINLKLILAGGLGWKYEGILKQLKPLIQSGDALLLDNLHPEDLKYLYSHSQAFVFPTLKEGFGLPPVEAMLCGVPVISSDIKVHKWVQGDSSFYVDPYNYEDLAVNIEKVVLNRDSDEMKKRIAKGISKAQKYNAKSNQEEWKQLFIDIQKGKFKV